MDYSWAFNVSARTEPVPEDLERLVDLAETAAALPDPWEGIRESVGLSRRLISGWRAAPGSTMPRRLRRAQMQHVPPAGTGSLDR